MTSIGIIGTGNVGMHLAKAFSSTGNVIVELYSRNRGNLTEISDFLNIQCVNRMDEFKSDMLFVCVPDHAVESVINEIPLSKCIVVTAGSIDINVVGRSSIGVFYPMQTFSKHIELSAQDYPVFIEGTSTEITNKLEQLAGYIGKKSYRSTHINRLHYHLSAVWVNNFTNHLLFQAKELADANKLNWELFYPLLDETIAKLKALGPKAAQTGPAKRNDRETIERHMSMLDDLQREIYTLVTQSIQNTYNSEEDGKL